MNNLNVKVIIENKQDKTCHLIADNVDYCTACIVLDNISDSIIRYELDEKFDIRMITNEVIDEITLYKRIVDYIADSISKDKAIEKSSLDDNKYVNAICPDIDNNR